MSIINVNNNQITYTPVKDYLQGSFIDVKGPNKFGRWLYYTWNIIVQQNIEYESGLAIGIPRDDMNKVTDILKYTITGTITKNIEDEILYYQMTDLGSENHPTLIIPANPYSNVDNVALTLWKSEDKGMHKRLTFTMFAVTRDPDKAKQAVFKVNLSTNVYSY